MGLIVSFTGYTPPRRFDDLPWTEARIEEAELSSGTWAQIDAIALDPLDADPSSPASRDFTTEAGTAVDQWYQIVFADANGDVSEPTEAIQNASPSDSAYATVEELASKLSLSGSRLVANSDGLQRVLNTAALEIDKEIGGPLLSPSEAELNLLATVNLGRAQDLWTIEGLPVGVIGLGGETPMLTPRDSWVRWANMLAAVKTEWGLA
jgi:hypothetical protein